MMIKNILVIEDDRSLRTALVLKLQKQEKYMIHSASDGRTALRIATETKPDLILLDLELPELTGLEILKRLRKDEQLRLVPVIILTNNDSKQAKQVAFHKGVPAYFIKSDISLKKIQEVVDYHLLAV